MSPTAGLRRRAASMALVASLVMASVPTTGVHARRLDDPSGVAALDDRGPSPVPVGTSDVAPSAPGSASASPSATRAVPATRGLDLSPAVVRSAVSAADEDYAPSPTRGSFGTERTASRARIDRSFEAAQIESCGGPDAFKFDPPTIGPVPLGGLLAMPVLLHAMAAGLCRF